MLPQPEPDVRMEVLAPAGSFEALEAALDAGADAVYLGLTSLNARRRAKNFSQEEFVRAVGLAHEQGARVYLTLNIDLAQREIGQAARILELARSAGADAVLVRDPALLALRELYPQIEFHFSTQTCMTSSADVAAAAELGAKRAVLARELSLAEISAASAVAGIQTEVFVQGALCFCVSGRCLLSSWAGGRSGNRGACTSPCRVPWTVGSRAAGTPLSMRDLATVDRLEDLRKAGVRSLKIEGRLKTAAWVGRAVSLYRRALAGEDVKKLLEEAAALGSYTGRQFTSGYLDAQRSELTGVAAGRSSSAPAAEKKAELPQEESGDTSDETGEEGGAGFYDFDLTVGEKGLVCRIDCNGRRIEWTIPKTVVRRAHKAVAVSALLKDLAGLTLSECELRNGTTNDGEFLLVPRAANAIVDRIATEIRHALKATEDDVVRIELPAEVREAIAAPADAQVEASGNILTLGEAPDRARLDVNAIGTFLRRVRASGSVDARPGAIIVENLTAHSLDKAVAQSGDIPLITALPAVFFEEDIAAIRELLLACAAASVLVEVNSWGGWRLAKQAGLRMEAGPGLGVLNSLAARVLQQHGMAGATLSIEADRKQLEDATAHCAVPLSLVVFGRPALMVSRVQLPREQLAQLFVDRRDVRMVPRLERNLWTFRSPEPFDLRWTRNPRICVAHLVMDLVVSPNPGEEWLSGADRGVKPFRFNYSRSLA